MIRFIKQSAGAGGFAHVIAYYLYGSADAVNLGLTTVSSDAMLVGVPVTFAVLYTLLARTAPAVGDWLTIVWQVTRTRNPERARMRMLTSEITDYAERTGCLRMQSACNRLMEQL